MIGTTRIWLAATAWAAAGAWRTWRAHRRRPSTANSATTAIPTMRRRSPGRASVESGASRIDSTENRLWRIFGWRALVRVGLAPAAVPKMRFSPKGWRRDRLTGYQYPKRGARRGTRPHRRLTAPRPRRRRTWASPRSTTGHPPGHQAHGGNGQDGVGHRHDDDDPDQGDVEHLGLAQDRAQRPVGDLVEGAAPERGHGASHHAVRSRATVASPTAKPSRQPTSADSPKGVGRKRSDDQAGRRSRWSHPGPAPR